MLKIIRITKGWPLQLLLAVPLALAGPPAQAEFWSATKLMQRLEADQRGEATMEVAVATGYVIGVADTLNERDACIPEGVTVKQLKQVVYNYMKSNPASWNNSADVLAGRALVAVWPCRVSK